MATERLTVSEVESVIRQLKGVIGARVVSDPAGLIQEIHVLTDSDRLPKQVVRDVESALQARLGIALDHKKVSVAQVQGNHQPASDSRLEFSDVSISLRGQTAEATVNIRRNGEVFAGSSAGASSTGGQIKAVASATLLAVQSSLPKSWALMVEDAVLSSIGGHQVVMVAVVLGGDRSDEVLIGACAVRQDIVKAAVFATLDAVNRRVSKSE